MKAETPCLPNAELLAEAGLLSLPDDWNAVNVGSLLADDRSIAVGVMYPGGHNPVGIPLFRVGDLAGSQLNLNPEYRISPQVHEEYRRTELKGGELLLTLVGGLGQCCVVPPSVAGWNAARAIAVIRLKNPKDADFVRFCLLSEPLQYLINAWATTTVQATLNLKEVRQLPLPWPSKQERDAIVTALRALDDKIELNRRMNRTLEELAAALFRSWFVDFDPVVAKAAGRKPAHLRPELAALFPAHFQDSPLGPIPQGWDVKPIGDVVKVVGGSTPSTNEPKFWSGDIAWATPRDLAALSDPVLIATDRQITRAGLDQISSSLLPKGTVLLSSRAPIGYTVITDIPAAVNQGFIALLCAGPLPNYYVIEWVRENMETIEGRANGTTFMEISKANFRPIDAIVPPPKMLEKFMEIASPWWRQIIHNARESRTLAALRDTLLPKLLSGELRVREPS